MIKRKKITTTQIIMLSFLLAILVGAVLLMLPISSATGHRTPFVDALFTATTATCVTGLVVVPTVTAWSVFGQAVILILIQLGGLGIITVLAGLSLALHRKIRISDSLLLQDAFNLNTLSGLGTFVKNVILGTFVVEGVGALLYMIVFVPEFGAKGIWVSVFTSVSAFCNAGIDIIKLDSLCDYVSNPVINGVTSALVILGGLGYIVWWDVLRVLRERNAQKISPWKRLTLHSKIAITATAVLLLVGTGLFFWFEYENPQTIGNMPVWNKLQAAFFQSMTTRTAGFFTVPQENLTNASSVLSLLLMFIGGSPVGTAGGIKTVTFVVLFASALATIKQRNDAVIFNRTLPKQLVSKATGVLCMSFSIMFLSTMLLAAVTNASAMDIAYETVSATATVGLSRNLTSSLNLAGKWIIIATMYLGRIGPISLAFALNMKKQSPNTIKYPTEDISVG